MENGYLSSPLNHPPSHSYLETSQVASLYSWAALFFPFFPLIHPHQSLATFSLLSSPGPQGELVLPSYLIPCGVRVDPWIPATAPLPPPVWSMSRPVLAGEVGRMRALITILSLNHSSHAKFSPKHVVFITLFGPPPTLKVQSCDDSIS